MTEKTRQKILSVLPVLGQPRDSKRITMLQELGFNVEAVSFEMNYHKGRLPNCNIKSLGVISHGKYLQRMILFMLQIQIWDICR